MICIQIHPVRKIQRCESLRGSLCCMHCTPVLPRHPTKLGHSKRALTMIRPSEVAQAWSKRTLDPSACQCDPTCIHPHKISSLACCVHSEKSCIALL